MISVALQYLQANFVSSLPYQVLPKISILLSPCDKSSSCPVIGGAAEVMFGDLGKTTLSSRLHFSLQSFLLQQVNDSIKTSCSDSLVDNIINVLLRHLQIAQLENHFILNYCSSKKRQESTQQDQVYIQLYRKVYN